MTPVDDPDARHLRRMQRDRPDGERKAPAAGAPKRGRRRERDDDPAHLEQWSDEDLEELPIRTAHKGRRRAETARRLASARQAAEPESPAPAATPSDGALLPGAARVVAVRRGPCEVELPSGEQVAAQLPKALARSYQATLAVGDEVQLERRPSGDLAVARVLPRRSRLSRPDPFHPRRERVLAANLDLGLVVASVRHPPFSQGLVDRFLVALRHGGIAAAVAVNKSDLLDPEERRRLEAIVAPYAAGGVPALFCSTRSGEGIEALRRLLAGRVGVLVGHSGVGKSSLLNALDPAAAARVGTTSSATGKGRHTTTEARIYRLDERTRIVDTPGIREFGLWRMSPRELAAYFDELAPYTARCRFSDCTHRDEPGCAVRAAAGEDAAVAERYATYLRILDSLARD